MARYGGIRAVLVVINPNGRTSPLLRDCDGAGMGERVDDKVHDNSSVVEYRPPAAVVRCGAWWSSRLSQTRLALS